jgi:hypothetical protein
LDYIAALFAKDLEGPDSVSVSSSSSSSSSSSYSLPNRVGNHYTNSGGDTSVLSDLRGDDDSDDDVHFNSSGYRFDAGKAEEEEEEQEQEKSRDDDEEEYGEPPEDLYSRSAGFNYGQQELTSAQLPEPASQSEHEIDTSLQLQELVSASHHHSSPPADEQKPTRRGKGKSSTSASTSSEEASRIAGGVKRPNAKKTRTVSLEM